jgi:hypothetical protein
MLRDDSGEIENAKIGAKMTQLRPIEGAGTIIKGFKKNLG